jgi:hypothetical protein
MARDAWDDEDDWEAGVADITEKLKLTEGAEKAAPGQPAPMPGATRIKIQTEVSPVNKSNVTIVPHPSANVTQAKAPPATRILARAPEEAGSMGRAHAKKKLPPIRQEDDVVDSALLSCLETHRNRMQLIETEQAIMNFIKSGEEERVFPPIHNSYWRLITFRVADRFRLGHAFTEDEMSSIILYKTAECSLPRTLLMDMDLDALYSAYANMGGRTGYGFNRQGSGDNIDRYGEVSNELTEKGGITVSSTQHMQQGAASQGGENGPKGKKIVMKRRADKFSKGEGSVAAARGAAGGAGSGSHTAGGGRKSCDGDYDTGLTGSRGGGKKGKSRGRGRGGTGDDQSDKERAYAEARARIFAQAGGGTSDDSPSSIFADIAR